MPKNTNNHRTDSRITSVNRQMTNELFYKTYGTDGIHMLTDTDAAPTGNYSSFIPSASTTISAITYNVAGLVTGDITSLTLTAGVQYFIPGGFSTITLGAGTMVLFKERN